MHVYILFYLTDIIGVYESFDRALSWAQTMSGATDTPFSRYHIEDHLLLKEYKK